MTDILLVIGISQLFFKATINHWTSYCDFSPFLSF